MGFVITKISGKEGRSQGTSHETALLRRTIIVFFLGVGGGGKVQTFVGAKKSTQTFFAQSFSTTLRVMDVRAENRGRPHAKMRFPAAPVVGRNFLTPGHSGVRVRNVRRKSGPKVYVYAVFSSLSLVVR